MTQHVSHRASDEVNIARQRLREALYASYNDLHVEGIVDAIEEYVSARLLEKKR
jgi:hypothetical protein